MKVLWVCNIMLPAIAEALHREASNKEGWLSGLLAQVAAEGNSNIELAVAFPVPMDDKEIPWKFCVELFGENRETEGINGAVAATLLSEEQKQEELTQTEQKCGITSAEKQQQCETDGYNIACYGFHEDTIHPDHYQPALEPELQKIIENVQPDVIHCFGTEYPHTLAACRVAPHKERLLLGIQGICTLCAEAYFADMPEKEIRKVTFRDLVKRDTLRDQQEKFVRRGVMEREAIRLAGNITGRTDWDKSVTGSLNPQAKYYVLNETLRADFYEGAWNPETCEPHSIFVSQGDYPLKGLHYLLKALPQIREQFPDVQVYVAGNDLTAYQTPKQKLKISAYGKYLRKLIREGQIEDRVHFLGKLTAEQMKERFLKSHLFLCCSSLENSPNSLGEAMLLGVPCISTEVGGIPSLFTGGMDGLWCAGHRLASNKADTRTDDQTGSKPDIEDTEEYAKPERTGRNENNTCNINIKTEDALEAIVNSMGKSVIEMWSNPAKMLEYSKNAREHARKTHNKTQNFAKMQEIYAKIAEYTLDAEDTGDTRNMVFVSNYFNHHQLPLCDALYELLEGSFCFLQTQPMEEERVKMGWQAQERPYVSGLHRTDADTINDTDTKSNFSAATSTEDNVEKSTNDTDNNKTAHRTADKYYDSSHGNDLCKDEALRLIQEADVVIFGGCDDESYIRDRLAAGKPVFRYNERMYKDGQWKVVSPRGLMRKYKDHTRYRKAPVYFLCAGAYVPCDYALIHAYPDKMLRFGYFPETRIYDAGQPFDRKKPGSILWAARMIDWKHPELAVKMASYLKKHFTGAFHINIIGGGELEEEMHRLAQELDVTEEVTFLGYRNPEEVRAAMEEAQIYLVTSDRKEGWGAVVNEAMNSGCAVVADHMIGAAPYLIRQGENGVMYRDGCEEELFRTVEGLLKNPEECRRLGGAAQRTVATEWNAQTAAERLVKLCEEMQFFKTNNIKSDRVNMQNTEDADSEVQLKKNEKVKLAEAAAPALPKLWDDGPCSPAPVIPERKMYAKCMQGQL